jgi:4-amino-4-deoxy-L-arabinose transferase-like glycosyltransferase
MTDRVHSSQRSVRLQVKNGRTVFLREEVLLLVMVAAFAVVAVILRNPFVGQWDSFDYVTKTVRHEVSDLAFGRPMFLAVTVAAWEVAQRLGAGVADAPAVVQSVVLVFSILGLGAFYFCVKPVGGKRLALWGVAWLSTTPMYVAYSGMVMTEIPSMACALAAVALLLHWEQTQKSRHLVWSALLLAAGIHMREQLVTTAAVFPFLVLINRRLDWRKKWRALTVHLLITAVAVSAVLVLLGRADSAYWPRVERWWSVFRVRNTGLLAHLIHLLKFALANFCVALPVMIATWRDWSKVLKARAIVAGTALLPLVALLTNSDLGIQPRYELIAAPAVIVAALVGVKVRLRRASPRTQRFVVAGILAGQLFFFLAGVEFLIHFNHMAWARKARVESLLATAPPNAVFVGGAYTPILEFYRQTGIRPGWRVIGSGWAWKENDLAELIAWQLKTRRPVYFLSGEKVWVFLRDELADVNALRSRFHFVPVNEGMEQIE